MKRFLGTFVMATAVIALAANAGAAINIASQSGSIMYTDFGNGLNATYLLFSVENTGAPITHVWVSLDPGASPNIVNVGTGIHELKYLAVSGHGNDPGQEFGLATNETKTGFFLVSATALGGPQTLTINVYSSQPATVNAGGTIGSQGFGFTVADTIQANANKVTTVVTIPNNPQPGQLGRITVSGCTGTVGASKVLFFSPVSADDWPADNFEFVSADIQIDNYTNSPYENLNLIPNADVLTTDNCYEDIFTFVINGAGSGSTTPANFITSGGTNVKHTTNTSGSFDVVIPVTCGDGTPVLVTAAPPGSQTVMEGDPITDVQFSASGGGSGASTYSFATASNLHGLSLSAAGLLSGTPTDVGGPFSIVIEATSTDGDPAGCQGTTNFSFTVNAPPPPPVETVVPTLSQWGMILLGLAIAGIGVKFLASRS